MSNSHHSSEDNEHYTAPEYADSGHMLMGGIDLDPASSALANTIIKAAYYYTKETNGFNKLWHGRVWWNPPGGICDKDGRIVVIARKASKTKPARKSCKETGACGLPPGHEHEDVTSTAKAWWFKGAGEYMASRMTTGLFIGFNLELLQTTQTPCFNSAGLPSIHDFPMCYPDRRMRFLTPNEEGALIEGGSPTHANVIVYLPKEWSAMEQMRFETLFEAFGRCVWPNKRVNR